MERRINIKTMTTAEDYKALIFFNMFLKKKAKFYFLIVAAVLSLGAIICRITGAVSMSDWYFYVCLAYWGLLVLEYLVFEFTVRRFLASDKLLINSERTVALGETGITVEDVKAESFTSYKWDKLFIAYETKKFYYLYINMAMALILPKRCFKEEELLTLKTLIKEKLGRKFNGK